MSKSKVKDRRSDVSLKRSSVSELVGKVSFLIHVDRCRLSVERVRNLAGASSTSHVMSLLSPARARLVNTGIPTACHASPIHGKANVSQQRLR